MQLSVNGIDTFVATGGRPFDPALPSVVILHGAGFDHSTWALHSRWFAHHGFSVLAPDLPGHGRSSGTPLSTIADMADWTAALLAAAGAPRAKLIGHSMGSLIALETRGAASGQGRRAEPDRHRRRDDRRPRSAQGRRGQRPRRHRHGLDLGPRLQGRTRRQPRARAVDAPGRPARIAADQARRALQGSRRLQRLSERARRSGRNQGAGHLDPRRARHDDAGESGQDARRRHSPCPHRGSCRARVT